MDKLDSRFATLLVVYQLFFGVGAAIAIFVSFPSTPTSGAVQFNLGLAPNQGFILLAFLAGMTGSFLHASQSLISYIGNATFKASWTAWYALRPWIGAVLGLAIYFAFRAGLVQGASVVNPYGVVAIGLLGGWFSKTTTDKLQEVFETLFKTEEDRKRKDKLRIAEPPIVESIIPSPVPANISDIVIVGRNFPNGAKVTVDGDETDSELISVGVLKTTVTRRPASGATAIIRVASPVSDDSFSKEIKTTFE